MLRTLWQNLNKYQRIGLIVIIQVIIISILAGALNMALQPKRHVELNNDSSNDILANIPDYKKRLYEEELWRIINQNVDDVDKNVIDDVIVREGSYEEEAGDKDGVVGARFIIDIDSIQQTYIVYMAWSNLPDETPPIIDCPSMNESKYPESICRGTYRNTLSLSLYLPYTIPAPQNNGAWDVYIEGDEYDRKIYVAVEDCNSDQLIQKAQNYLDTIPTDLSDYTIEYEITSPDGGYFTNLSDSEIEAVNKRCNYAS